MSTRPNLFITGTSSRILNLGTRYSTEVDLREEFDEFIFGNDGNIRNGHPLVVRHMRRDSNGRKVNCVCKNNASKSPDPDCSYCLGEGYLWDESWYIGRSQYVGADGGLGSKYRFVSPGEIRADTKIFFLRYDVNLRYGDKIVEMLLDTEGNPITPYVREAIYKPETINRLRGAHGRTEFITVYCLEKDAIRPDVFQ